MVEPSRQPSDGSEPSTDHSRYDLEPQDQVAGGRWLLHVGGSCGLLPGLESATAKISGSGRSGVPPNMSTWCIPSGVARGAAQPEHDMARPALQHHPTHGGARDHHEDAERRTLAPTQKSSATPGSGGSGRHGGLARGPGGKSRRLRFAASLDLIQHNRSNKGKRRERRSSLSTTVSLPTISANANFSASAKFLRLRKRQRGNSSR